MSDADRSDNLKRRRRERPLATIAAAALLLALILGSLFENRVDLYRHLFQLFVLFALVFLPLCLPRLLRRWREVLLLLAASAVCVLPLWLAGPWIMRTFVLPVYSLDVDHHPRPHADGTNEDGLYTDLSPSDVSETDFSILFLGDSFTQGLKVPRRFNFVERAGRELRARYPDRNVKVVNFGWTSSAPILQLRRLRAIGEKYKPDLVVQAFDMGDFHNDQMASRMFKERYGLTRAGEISIFHAMLVRFSLLLGVPNVIEWLRSNLDLFDTASSDEAAVPQRVFFHMFQPLEESEPYFELSWNTILETREWARERGVDYALVVYPRYPQHNRRECPDDWQKAEIPASDAYIYEVFRYFERQAKTVDFPILSLLETFQTTPLFPLCFRQDPHWNRAGHQVAAQGITRFLIAERFLED